MKRYFRPVQRTGGGVFVQEEVSFEKKQPYFMVFLIKKTFSISIFEFFSFLDKQPTAAPITTPGMR